MKLTITMYLLLMWFTSLSQTTITGSVSAEGYSLAEANIIIKNTNKGTTTSFDGNFKIKANENDTLVVSYLGYNSKEIIVENKKEIKVALEGNIALNTVEIIAYCSHRCVRMCCGGIIKQSHITTFKSDLVTEKLYPNPSKTGRFQLKLLEEYKTLNVQVFNISGQLVKSVEGKPNNKILQLDLSDMNSGMYILSLEANGKQLTTKKAIID
ncbi:T9SS type A sorting domain-containing protein [Hyunsoonleella pacifica]|uniref:T9SS type A sorting domain-containing protein n=1 Tax=Hyunsoonleella pacifica TaxID=1080224 RepID=A0A4Q9FLG6_9FLAO|nr:T9SS type A sorting domain-containing protein [Hyunsoonleella pacifica]TBN14484.1 T9SS type A sorting domain-containing protein [Hyunsoonleella pacifica]GGD14116.1 hypothetical protein GCM10011368_15130 [Hyunsoonleella pacifica]